MLWFIDTNCLYNGFYKNCLYNGFSHELFVCDGFFIHIVSFKIIFSTKRDYVYVFFLGGVGGGGVGGGVKMC